MMKLSKLTWVGMVILAIGLAYGVCVLYIVITIDHPLSMPIHLRVGEINSPEFRIYANKSYNIYIEVKKNLPLQVLDCSLGVSMGPLDPYNCKRGESSLLQVNWILWSDGRYVDKGSSDEYMKEGGWGDETVDRFIGRFNGKAGEQYMLQLNIKRDGSLLSVTDPQLNVGLTEMPSQEDIKVIYCLVTLFLIMEAIGICLLIISGIRIWRSHVLRESKDCVQ